MFLFLTVVQALIAAALVAVVLMQQSEGGGLGVGGGSPSGLMSARGAANFMTRATGILATLFVVLSIVLAALAVDQTTGRDIDTSLQRNTAPADPLAGSADQGAVTADKSAPAEKAPADDPLSGAAKQ
ncbi:MAG: preprotein translocase subunit SecG [Novosphingobium sp.]